MKNAVDSTTWRDLLVSAMRAFRLDDLDLAEERLDKAFSAAKEPVPYLHLLAGRIALTRGATKEAEKSWRRVLEIDPQNAEAWNNLGVLYRRYGDDEKALDAFREAQERAPDRPDIPYNIGNLHKSAKRYDDAISAYNRAIEVDPDYAPAYNNLGTLYESRNERQKAMEVFRRGLSADAGDASLRFNVGLVHQEEGRWDEARDSFNSALKSRPGWVPGLNNLGIVLQEMGKEDEAARTFRTLLDVEPDNVSALNNLGVAYDRLGRTDDARACFKHALEEEPNYVKAALNLHDSYRENQELNEALEELNKQINHHPTNPDIRVRMARTLMGLTRYDDAEMSLEHVLERNPDHTDALRTKADLYLATSRPEEAENILNRLPHDPEVVRDLARLNISTDRSESAERLLGELIAVNPDDAESRRLMADLIAADKPADALRLREEAAAADPGSADDLISLADLYGKIGDKDQALGKLDEAVSLLGSRGDADDLDAMVSVLGLYENAAAALENERGGLFSERTAQLGRKLQSAMGLSGMSDRQRRRIASEEMPLEEEDALSLLDLNAMEPVIRINEEEETVYLDESAEDLEDAYTELYDRERYRPDPGLGGEAAGRPGPDSSSPAQSGAEGTGGPPVHIHLPQQTGLPPTPQVIYQDVRPVVSAPVQAPAQPPPPADFSPEISVEEIREDEIPSLEEEPEGIVEEEVDPFEIVLEEESDETEAPEEPEVLDLEEMETVPDEEEDLFEDSQTIDEDDTFLIPDSDALSEELPEIPEPKSDPLSELIFPEDEKRPSPDVDEDEFEEVITVEEPETFLMEDFDVEHPAEPFEAAGGEEESTEPAPGPEGENLPPEKVAEMFKYLSELTDETTGDGRQSLIEEGVPLKLAGLHAKLSGEPRFREVAQKFDRRRRERHNVELDDEKIRGSFDAFKSLAEALPQETVGQSLSKKLGKLLSVVEKLGPKNPDSSD